MTPYQDQSPGNRPGQVFDEQYGLWRYTDEAMAGMSGGLTCENCGAEVPSMPEHGMTLEMNDRQLCSDCCDLFYGCEYNIDPADGYAGYNQ